jgi:multimeric flavodoxin WrbA
MKVVAVNGSARKGGNTFRLLQEACTPLEAAGIEREIIELAGKEVRGCSACMRCREVRDGQCHGRDDFGNKVIEAVSGADALLLGSPTYFSDVTSEMKALIDRLGYVTRSCGSTLARKPAAAVVVARRAEQGGSRLYSVSNQGIEALIPGNANRLKAIDAAMQLAQQKVEEAGRSPDVLRAATENTEALLRSTFRAVGWTLVVRWENAPRR